MLTGQRRSTSINTRNRIHGQIKVNNLLSNDIEITSVGFPASPNEIARPRTKQEK
jgi:hypothetical protein